MPEHRDVYLIHMAPSPVPASAKAGTSLEYAVTHWYAPAWETSATGTRARNMASLLSQYALSLKAPGKNTYKNPSSLAVHASLAWPQDTNTGAEKRPGNAPTAVTFVQDAP